MTQILCSLSVVSYTICTWMGMFCTGGCSSWCPDTFHLSSAGSGHSGDSDGESHFMTSIGITQPTLSESVIDIRGLSSLKSPVYRMRLTTSHSSSSLSKRSMTEPGQWWEGTAVVRSL